MLQLFSIFVYLKLKLMIIKLVSFSCVDNMQYYDAVICSNSIEFKLTDVYYDIKNHLWSVKFPNRPLFETILFCDLISYLSGYVRDLFYL